MFELSARQIQKIQDFQRNEIERLASDRQFALDCSKLEHYSRIGEWIPPSKSGRVLELGCGPGKYAAMLASIGHEVVGVDPFPFEDTWKVLRRYREVELTSGIFAESLPFADASFDYVTCMGALLYFKDANKAAAEIRRVLRPGGRLLVRTINRRNLYRVVRGRNIDPATNNAYTPDELTDFLTQSGFTVRQHFTHGLYSPFFSMQFWYLLNGLVSINAQQWMSDIVPKSLRTVVTIFAELRDSNLEPRAGTE
jgi:ubiquinone/menaquinone biosynthesis C-methylase UbiE